MPYAFDLPTPSPLLLQSCLTSPTHPQLPYHATTARHAVRTALKRCKKCPRSQREDALLHARNALEEYIGWLVILIEGVGHDLTERGSTSGSSPSPVIINGQIEAEWSPVVLSSKSKLPHLSSPSLLSRSSSLPQARSNTKRIKHPGFAYELAFTLTAYAFTLSNLARLSYLRTLYATHIPPLAERTASLQSCTRDLQLAASIHAYISTCPFFASLNSSSGSHTCAPDVQLHVQSALKSLCLAEATLLSTVKDDAYLTACIQLRNKHDTDWMIKAPDIPRLRTLLFARICVRAAELANEAEGAIGVAAASHGGNDCAILRYTSVLIRVARARACRFLGIEAEDGGRTGEGIAWLRAGQEALLSANRRRPSAGTDEKEKETGRLGLRKWKEDWKERREEKRAERKADGGQGRAELDEGLAAGDDAGRMEEGRVLEWLRGKWEKMNDTIYTQRVPPHQPLLAQLPSGRDILPPLKVYEPKVLGKERLEACRNSALRPDHEQTCGEDDLQSSSDEGDAFERDYF